MSEELKPWPFCGQKPEVFGSLGVMCANAECALEAIAMPIEDWNRRALSLPNGPSELNVLKFLDQLGTDLTDIHNGQPGGRGLALPPPSISPASEETQFSRLALRVRRFADELRAVSGSNGSATLRDAEREEREMLKLIDERDAAEEALGQAFYLIAGRSPEWSNEFGHAEALEEIADAQTLLRKSAFVERGSARPDWRTNPKVLDAHRALMERLAVCGSNHGDPTDVHEKLDALCEAVASSGAPAPTQEKFV